MNILFSIIPTILVFLLTSYKGLDIYKTNKKSLRKNNRYKIKDSSLKSSDFSEKILNSEEKKFPSDIKKSIIKGKQMADKQTLLHMRRIKKDNPSYDFKTFIIKTEGKGNDKLGKTLYEKRDWSKHHKLWKEDKLGRKTKKPRKTKKK